MLQMRLKINFAYSQMNMTWNLQMEKMLSFCAKRIMLENNVKC
jgi:hypothetical protein